MTVGLPIAKLTASDRKPVDSREFDDVREHLHHLI